MDEPRMMCQDDRRRTALREDGRLNGIDYVEADSVNGRAMLRVYLLGGLPQGDTPWLDQNNITIEGPTSLSAGHANLVHAPDDERDDWIDVTLDQDWPADRSPYTLHLTGSEEHPLDDLDPRYASATFRFLPENATTELDCLQPVSCPPGLSQAPNLNYLAKDYASFRQLLLDRLAVTLPGWRDHHSPDLYLTMIEILAYHADHLSYAQDAVATEAYLDTARLRTSVRRHARLVDYRMHEGCNARAWICLKVAGNPSVRVDQSQFLTRPEGILANGPVLLEEDIRDAPRSSYEVFEPLPEMGWEEIAEHDIEQPLALTERALHDSGALMSSIREMLTDDMHELLRNAGELDEHTLRSVLARFLRDLLDDPGFAAAGDGKAIASGRYGTTNALRGAALRRYNRCKLQETFPNELLQPARYRFHETHNAIPFHTWHEAECCLPKGTTRATLSDYWLDDDNHELGRALDHLAEGNVLILEELVNPRTGNPADVDPAHCHAVRLTSVEPGIDPLGNIPVVEIAWDAADALPFALTLSAIGSAPECALLEGISVARGNVVLVDHGETVRQPPDQPRLQDGARTFLAVPFEPPDDVVPTREHGMCCAGERRLDERPLTAAHYAPRLARSPVVFADMHSTRDLAASKVLDQDVRRARPQVFLFSPVDHPRPWMDILQRLPDMSMARSRTSNYERWHPRFDLLASDADDRHFVVEVDDRGIAHIRFGDGELGARPAADTRYLAWYRIGGGTAGNVGRDAITTLLLRGEIRGGSILGIRNPLPARGGTAPEGVWNVRLHAPHAFRATLQRAITLDDYAAIALREFPERIQRAAARIEDPDQHPRKVTLSIDLTGTNADDPAFRATVLSHMERYRRIGHRLEVRQAEYVPLDLTIEVQLAPHHQPGAVLRALKDRFGNQLQPNGKPGVFHPDAWTFGQDVPVSMIVAAALEAAGVTSVHVTTLKRQGSGDPDMPVNDVVTIEQWEIARLDNDPGNSGNGVLTIRQEAAP